MHQGIVDWTRATLPSELIRGKRVLDVGSFDWNGSLRPWVEGYRPREYHGIDILEGEGVDEVLDACDLLEAHGPQRWDLILCLEMLEHAERWQEAVYQMKESLADGGWLILTTRSTGYPYHAPPDYWRFPKEVLREAFADLDDVETWSDPGYSVKAEADVIEPVTGIVIFSGTYNPQAGVFIRGRKGGAVSRPTAEAVPAPAENLGTEAIRGF